MHVETQSPAVPASPIQVLRGLTQDFLAAHPRLTLQALATRSQVPVTSLRRLMQEECKTEVAPHTALNLCAYMLREKRVGKLLQALPPVLAEFLAKHFGSFVFEGGDERRFDQDLNEALKDRMSYFIYKLAANSAGTSWVELVELFGSSGKRKAEEMVEQGLLLDADGKIAARHKDFSLDLRVAAGHLPELVKFYRPENLGQGRNLMYSLSESVNEDAIQRIKDVQREAAKKTHEIMRQPESRGGVPYFTLNLCETFLETQQGVLQ